MAKAVTVCIIGRGKSGTRIPAQLILTGDGYIGRVINASLDKSPFYKIYEAARLVGEHVDYLGNYQWDFSKLHTMSMPAQFKALIDGYLKDIVREPKRSLKGWKLPETILIYPLLVRYMPDIHYLFWHRNPYDVILRHHNTQHLEKYNIEMPALNGLTQREKDLEKRAISWLYQWEIVQQTPQPKHFLSVSYDDFIKNPEQEIERIEGFLDRPLGRIVVRQSEPKPIYPRLSFPFLDHAYPQKNLV